MVIVVVRDDHRVERREIADGHWHGLKSLRPEEAARRHTSTPDRIRKDPHPIDLEQQRRVPQPSRPQTGVCGLRPDLERAHRRQGRDWHTTATPEQKLPHDRHRRTLFQARAYPGRVAKGSVGKPNGCLHAFPAEAIGSAAEGGHCWGSYRARAARVTGRRCRRGRIPPCRC